MAVRHTVQALVISLLPLATSALNLLDTCVPPTVAGSGASTLKVAFHNATTKDLCHLQAPAVDETTIAEHCTAFCSLAGRTTGLPLQLGGAQYGLNLDQMATICVSGRPSGVLKHDATLEGFCKARTLSLHAIENKAAQFVARLKALQAQQVAFMATARSAAKDLQAQLTSQAFAQQLSRSVDRVALLKQRFAQFTAEITQDASATSALPAAMSALRQSQEELSSAISTNITAFEDFVNQCNIFLLSTGGQEEFLLDICAQSSIACIEATEARHAACCCGLNPVVAPHVFDIDGLASLGAGAHLQGQQSQAIFHEIDVCAEAARDSAADVEAAYERVRDAGEEQLLLERELSWQSRYSLYHAQCSGAGRRLSEKRTGARAKNREPSSEERERHGEKRLHPNLRSLDSSNAAQVLHCNPPSPHGATRLKVAFSNTTEQDLCHLQSPPLGKEEMLQQCGAFCEKHGVPILIGSETAGFSLNVSESICLPPDGVLLHSPQKLAECQRWSAGFHDIQASATDFISQLNIFVANRLLYVAQLRNTTADIQRLVRTPGFIEEIQRAVDKVRAFSDAIKAELDSSNVKAVESELILAMKALRERAQSLRQTMDEKVPLMQRFLSECNNFYVGEGREREYLLDLCAIDSVNCIEHSSARHASCCCAYHPFSSFGEPPPDFPISGISGFGGPARVAADRRLAAEGSQWDGIDACAQAWIDAAPMVENLHAKIVATAETEVLSERETLMSSKYGDHYCAYGELTFMLSPSRVQTGCAWSNTLSKLAAFVATASLAAAPSRLAKSL